MTFVLDTKRKCGVALIAIGIVLVVIGIVIYEIIPELVNAKIQQEREAFAPSQDLYEYDTFAAPSATTINRAYYLFNITNCNEFQNGLQAPIFESVGPYQYSTVTYKINITFNEDISLVSYKEWLNYTWNEEASRPWSDSFCAFNVGYLGLLAKLDNTENGLLLALAGGIGTKISQGLQPLLGSVIESKLSETACTRVVAVALDDAIEGVFASFAQQLSVASTVNATNSASFSAQFNAGALASLPSLAAGNLLGRNGSASPLSLLPLIFLDYLPAEIIFKQAGSSIYNELNNGNTTAEAADFTLLTVNDYRLLLCSINGLNESPALCELRSNSITPSSALGSILASDGAVDIIYDVLSEVLDTMYTTYGELSGQELSEPAHLGTLQFTSMLVLGSPYFSTTPPISGAPVIVNPLEIGFALGANSVNISTATDILQGLLVSLLLEGKTGTAALAAVNLPPAYALYLDQWLLTEVFFPTIVAGTASTLPASILSTYDYQVANVGYGQSKFHGTIEVVSISGNTTININLAYNLTGLPLGSYNLSLFNSVQATGYCTASSADTYVAQLGTVDISSAVGTIVLSGLIPSNPLTAAYPLLVLSPPGVDPTSHSSAIYSGSAPGTPSNNKGFCAPLHWGGYQKLYDAFFTVQAYSPANNPTVVNSFEFPSQSPSFPGIFASWHALFGFSISPAGYPAPFPVLIYHALVIQVYEALYTAAGPLSAYLPPTTGNYGEVYANLLNMQIATGVPLDLTGSQLNQQNTALQALPFTLEVPIQSQNHIANVPNGFPTTTAHYVSYTDAAVLVGVMTNPANATLWRANGTAYLTSQGFTSALIPIGNYYLQYPAGLYLFPTFAWITQLIPTQSPVVPIINLPTDFTTIVINGQTPALYVQSAYNLLESLLNVSTCTQLLTLPLDDTSLLPFNVTAAQLQTVNVYFESVLLYSYNAIRASVGLLSASNVTDGFDDFFYVQLGTNFLTGALGSPETVTIREAVELLAGNTPATQELLAILGDYELEIWASAESGAVGLPWSPYNKLIASYPSPIPNVYLTPYQAKDIWGIVNLPIRTQVGLITEYSFYTACMLNTAAAVEILTNLQFTTIAADEALIPFIPYYVSHVGALLATNLFNNPLETGGKSLSETSGLVVKRTAQELIEGFEDPLFVLMQAASLIGYNIPVTYDSAVASTVNYYTYYTTGEYVGLLQSYNGTNTTLSWGNDEESINLASDGTSVPPLYTSDTVNVYIPNFDRVFEHISNGSSSVLGIPTNRYAFNFDQLLPADSKDVAIAGILPLSSVVGSSFQGSTMFLTLPMFCGVDLSSFEPTSYLINASVNCFPTLYTYVDIEPNTGLVFNALQQFEINAVIIPGSYPFFNANLSSTLISANNLNIASPLFYQSVFATLDSNQASTFDNSVEAAYAAGKGVLIALVIVGAIAIVVGVVLLILKPSDEVLTKGSKKDDFELEQKYLDGKY